MIPSVSPSQQHASMMGNAFNLTSITLLLTSKQIFSIKLKCKILLTLADQDKRGPDSPPHHIKNYSSHKKWSLPQAVAFVSYICPSQILDPLPIYLSFEAVVFPVTLVYEIANTGHSSRTLVM